MAAPRLCAARSRLFNRLGDSATKSDGGTRGDCQQRTSEQGWRRSDMSYITEWANTDLEALGKAADDGDQDAIKQLTEWGAVAGFDRGANPAWTAVANYLSERVRQQGIELGFVP